MAPPLRLALLWHMHQPMYRLNNEVVLPWTRLHATKDYHEMIRILESHPAMRCSINFVPSLLLQVRGYGEEHWTDELRDLLRLRAETYSQHQTDRLLYYARLLPRKRMVDPYEKLSALLDLRSTELSAEDIRDLQVLYSLLWLGEHERENPVVAGMLDRGRSFSEQEWLLLQKIEDRILSNLLDTIRSAEDNAQIELSTTPFYHPILPLLLDLRNGELAEPGTALPSKATGWTEDVDHHLDGARKFHTQHLGKSPRGCWPSEGSLCTETLLAISRAGYDWTASDQEILRRTRGDKSRPYDHAFPWRFLRDGEETTLFFRDHDLSDRIGFNYGSMNPKDAVDDFFEALLSRRDGIVREFGEESLQHAVLPVILDGENCWEHYEGNGRPFLDHFYSAIVENELVEPTTFAEVVDSMELSEDRVIDKIEPGSWIGGNFKIWVGGSEENRAWDLLAETREALMSQRNVVPEEEFFNAYEEFLVAQGSDWFWWFGEENNSANDMDFDLLFRQRLTSVYRLISLTPPDSLAAPIRSPKQHISTDRSSGSMHRA